MQTHASTVVGRMENCILSNNDNNKRRSFCLRKSRCHNSTNFSPIHDASLLSSDNVDEDGLSQDNGKPFRASNNHLPSLDSTSMVNSPNSTRDESCSKKSDVVSLDEDGLSQDNGKPFRASNNHLPSLDSTSMVNSPNSTRDESCSKKSDVVSLKGDLSNNVPSFQSGRRSSRISQRYLREDKYSEYEWDMASLRHKKRPKNERVLDELYQDNLDERSFHRNSYSNDSDSEIQNGKDNDSHGSIFAVGQSREFFLTARQKAIQMSKTTASEAKESIELPNDSCQFKEQKKILDPEQQLRKLDAAQRRREENQKAAQKIQDEAIKKILGNSQKQKQKQDKINKQREKLKQAKRDAANTVASNSIRWVSGPAGTVISFSKDVDILGMFSSSKSRYPPEREKCAVPSCNNSYKYRDSKSNLPLCSLLCYKKIQNSF